MCTKMMLLNFYISSAWAMLSEVNIFNDFLNFITSSQVLTVTNMLFLILDVGLPTLDFFSDLRVLFKYWNDSDFDWVIILDNLLILMNSKLYSLNQI